MSTTGDAADDLGRPPGTIPAGRTARRKNSRPSRPASPPTRRCAHRLFRLERSDERDRGSLPGARRWRMPSAAARAAGPRSGRALARRACSSSQRRRHVRLRRGGRGVGLARAAAPATTRRSRAAARRRWCCIESVADGSEELQRGAVVRQGDEIRVGYRASGRAYGAILSIDGRGNLTQHLPRDRRPGSRVSNRREPCYSILRMNWTMRRAGKRSTS